MKTLFLLIFGFALFAEANVKLSLAFREVAKKSTVTVLGETYKYSDEIMLAVNGKLAATGDCSPRVKLGLIKRNQSNTWDTVTNILNIGTSMCGFGTHEWTTDTVSTIFAAHCRPKSAEDIPGTYRFTYIAYHRGKQVVKASNEFRMEH